MINTRGCIARDEQSRPRARAHRAGKYALLAGTLIAVGCGGARVREDRVGPPMPAEHGLAPWAPAPHIAGDPIWLEVPRDHNGGCQSGSPEITQSVRADGVTEIVLGPAPEGVCPIVPRGEGPSLVRVGELDAGRYVVRCSDPACAGYEHAFDVLPGDTDPGELDTRWRIRIAVVDAHPPGNCFGMPSPGDRDDMGSDPLRELRESQPLLFRQLQRAYPGRDPDALVEAARVVDVVQRGEGHWEYGYTDGSCCTIRELGGHVHIERDGTIRVEEPRVFESRSVPC